MSSSVQCTATNHYLRRTEEFAQPFQTHDIHTCVYNAQGNVMVHEGTRSKSNVLKKIYMYFSICIYVPFGFLISDFHKGVIRPRRILLKTCYYSLHVNKMSIRMSVHVLSYISDTMRRCYFYNRNMYMYLLLM